MSALQAHPSQQLRRRTDEPSYVADGMVPSSRVTDKLDRWAPKNAAALDRGTMSPSPSSRNG